jgi:hypothetical protein
LRSQGHWIPQSVQTLLAPDERRQLPEEGDDTYHYLEEIVPVSFDPEGPTSRKESSDKITSTNFPQKTGETERLTRLNKQLSTEIELLKAELRKNVPYLQLYRFGAGAVSLSIISLICWLVSGVSMPFHPAFAITTLPVGIAFMAMSWITRKNAGKSEL